MTIFTNMLRLGVFITLLSFFNGRSIEGNIRVVNISGLFKAIEKVEKGVKVVNFWATWCGPCVKELPLFEKVNVERSDIHIMLVSMDLDLDSDKNKVIRFVDHRKILCPVFILDEKNPNNWISKIDSSWTGALPATLLINQATGKRLFFERELREGELEKLADSLR